MRLTCLATCLHMFHNWHEPELMHVDAKDCFAKVQHEIASEHLRLGSSPEADAFHMVPGSWCLSLQHLGQAV